MSQGNLEIVRHFLEALAGEDWVALTALIADDCEIHDFDIPDADVYRGPDGLMDWLTAWDEAWESWEARDLDFRRIDNDRVVAQFRMVATGKSSGLEMNREDAIVYILRDGKICGIEYYNEQQKGPALEALGLEV